MKSARTAAGALLLASSAIGTIAKPSLAQSAGDGFLFRVPYVTWSVRGGFNLSLATGDVFSFVTRELTLDRSDFNSATFGTNLGVRLSSAADLVFDLGFTHVSRRSEFRNWVDQNDQPIEQTTSLRRIPITLGVKHYLASRGRSIGRFAWIPAARATYLGLGAGFMQYRFHQIGDFVDFETLEVFPDEFESKAWTPVLHGLAGIDVSLGRFFLLNGEARYTWARGPMGRDFVGFDRIDLSGLSLTTGLSIRF